MYYNNFYFDSDDYETPIKTYVDDRIWFTVMPKITKEADIYVRKNFLELQDSYLQVSGGKKESFISISGDRETIMARRCPPRSGQPRMERYQPDGIIRIVSCQQARTMPVLRPASTTVSSHSRRARAGPCSGRAPRV